MVIEPDRKVGDAVSKLPLALQWPDLLSMVPLLKKYNLGCLVPRIYYLCSQLPASRIMDGFTRGVWTDRELLTCIEGREVLIEVGSGIVQTMIRNFAECDEGEACRSSVSRADWSPRCLHPLAPFRSIDFNAELYGICSECIEGAIRYYDSRRASIWDTLGDYFSDYD